MKIEYISPAVEVICFMAAEKLANTPEAEEARREGRATGDGGDMTTPSFGEGVMPWPFG